MKKIDAKRNGTRVVFQCRFSYAHLEKPWSGEEGQEKKYSICAIIPKDDAQTIKTIKEAIEQAKKEGQVSKWGGTLPKKLHNPLRDGDEERDAAEYEETMFLSASSTRPVAVLNALKQPIDPEEAYSGAYGLVSVGFFPFNSNGNKGIGAGLNAVLKLADGERLGGGGDGRHDFDDVDLGVEEGLDDL